MSNVQCTEAVPLRGIALRKVLHVQHGGGWGFRAVHPRKAWLGVGAREETWLEAWEVTILPSRLRFPPRVFRFRSRSEIGGIKRNRPHPCCHMRLLSVSLPPLYIWSGLVSVHPQGYTPWSQRSTRFRSSRPRPRERIASRNNMASVPDLAQICQDM